MLKHENGTDVPTSENSSPTEQRQVIPDSPVEGAANLLSQRHLDELPQEILLNIVEHFAEPWVLTDDLADWQMYKLDIESKIRQYALIALTRTCRRLNMAATSILYRCAHLPTALSFFNFARALDKQPSLRELVKQVSCPHDVLMSVAYVFFRRYRDGYAAENKYLHHFSPPIAVPRRPGQSSQSHYSYSRVAVHRSLLDCLLRLIPRIRALSVTCYSPWYWSYPISPMPLEHLSKLSIAMRNQPEVYLRDSGGGHQPILTWLSRSALGYYPALERLELVHARGKWVAHLVTVETTTKSGSNGIEKYVEELATFGYTSGGLAEWELLSLQLDIFSQAHLRTLNYAGSSRRCTGRCRCSNTQTSGWDLNYFLSTTGRQIWALCLDWEHEHTQLNQLGPAGRLTSLPMLANLTHLIVSMQVLFQNKDVFADEVNTILNDMEAGVARLFPSSLRILRLCESKLDILQPSNPVAEDRNIYEYNWYLYNFIRVLRAWWVDVRDGRQIWFRHCLKLEQHPRMANQAWRSALRWLISPQNY